MSGKFDFDMALVEFLNKIPVETLRMSGKGADCREQGQDCISYVVEVEKYLKHFLEDIVARVLLDAGIEEAFAAVPFFSENLLSKFYRSNPHLNGEDKPRAGDWFRQSQAMFLGAHAQRDRMSRDYGLFLELLGLPVESEDTPQARAIAVTQLLGQRYFQTMPLSIELQPGVEPAGAITWTPNGRWSLSLPHFPVRFHERSSIPAGTDETIGADVWSFVRVAAKAPEFPEARALYMNVIESHRADIEAIAFGFRETLDNEGVLVSELHDAEAIGLVLLGTALQSFADLQRLVMFPTRGRRGRSDGDDCACTVPARDQGENSSGALLVGLFGERSLDDSAVVARLRIGVSHALSTLASYDHHLRGQLGTAALNWLEQIEGILQGINTNAPDTGTRSTAPPQGDAATLAAVMNDGILERRKDGRSCFPRLIIWDCDAVAELLHETDYSLPAKLAPGSSKFEEPVPTSVSVDEKAEVGRLEAKVFDAEETGYEPLRDEPVKARIAIEIQRSGPEPNLTVALYFSDEETLVPMSWVEFAKGLRRVVRGYFLSRDTVDRDISEQRRHLLKKVTHTLAGPLFVTKVDHEALWAMLEQSYDLKHEHKQALRHTQTTLTITNYICESIQRIANPNKKDGRSTIETGDGKGAQGPGQTSFHALFSLAGMMIKGPWFSEIRPERITFSKDSPRLIVLGNDEAAGRVPLNLGDWTIVIYTLLKNAIEAAKAVIPNDRRGEVELIFRYRDNFQPHHDTHYMTLEVRNPSEELDSDTLKRMRLSLNGELERMPRNRNKNDSTGVGLPHVGKLLKPIRARSSINQRDGVVTISITKVEIDDILT